jgi:hypothetical protein
MVLTRAKSFARTPPNVSERQPRYRHGALRRRPGPVATLLLVKTGAFLGMPPCRAGATVSTYDDRPDRHYWRVLYPEYASPDSTAHWYGKWKTAEMCMGLFGERQQARHEWIATGPRRGREEAHATAVVTYHASPVRSRTVKVCLTCLWISPDLDAEHAGATFSA